MFVIAHDGLFVYSIITVTEIKGSLKDETIEELMFIWANQTAIPYLRNLARFKTDDVVWYLKEKK